MKVEFRYLVFLMGAFFIQAGNHFFALGLSAFVFMTTSSVIKSSLILLFSAIPSIFLSNILGRVIDNRLSKDFLLKTLLLSIFTTSLCGIIIWLDAGTILLCIVLSTRSLICFVTKTSLTKWLKVSTPDKLQLDRFRLYYFTFFLSTGLSGILVGLALIHLNILILVLVEASLIFIGGSILIHHCVILCSAPTLHANQFSRPTFASGFKIIFSNSELYVHFLLVIISQASLQGAYTVLISTLPLKEYFLGSLGVTFFQTAASIGITLGFAINWIYSEKLEEKNVYLPLKSISICLLALLFLLILTFFHNIWCALLAFFGMNFAYECIWLYNQTAYIKASPPNVVAQLQFLLGSIASFMMGIFSTIYAVLIDEFGLSLGTEIYLTLIGILLMALCSICLVKSNAVLPRIKI